MTDGFPRWALWICGLFAALSGGTCLALGIDVNWAVLSTTAFSGLVFAWVLLRQPPESSQSRHQSPDIDEEFVRRLEALAARMRQDIERRRAS